ncbi:MAG: methyltransferase domain-containing protein [Gemmatimonadales bacterium]
MTLGAISRIGHEALDTRQCEPGIARATLRDIARANALFGGTAAVGFGVAKLLGGKKSGAQLSLLDAGAGAGDITAHLSRKSPRREVAIKPYTLDFNREAVRTCSSRGLVTVMGDVHSIPFRDDSFDIVVASQLLHHFARPAAATILREFARVARRGVVVADLERASLAAAGIWVASLLLGFHPVTRHDSVVSVQRGFSPQELSALLRSAGMHTRVYRRPGYRLVAAWRA